MSQVRNDAEQAIVSLIERSRSLAAGLSQLVEGPVDELVNRVQAQLATLEAEVAAVRSAVGSRGDNRQGAAPAPTGIAPTEAIRTSAVTGAPVPERSPDQSDPIDGATSRSKTPSHTGDPASPGPKRSTKASTSATSQAGARKRAATTRSKPSTTRSKAARSTGTATSRTARGTSKKQPSGRAKQNAVGASGVAPILTRNPNK